VASCVAKVIAEHTNELTSNNTTTDCLTAIVSKKTAQLPHICMQIWSVT